MSDFFQTNSKKSLTGGRWATKFPSLLGRKPVVKSFDSSCLGWKHGSKWVFDFTGGLERQAATSLDAHVAQLVEHILGKDEVTSSNLVMGSIKNLFINKYNGLTNKK